MTGRWSLLSLMLPANVLGSWSPTAIAVADVRQRIYGHFPDVDVVKVSWRTKPLEAQIPVKWLARKIHNWSAKKIFSKRKDLPSSRDFYNSWIDVTVLQNEGFFEFREVICKCIPKASRMAIKRPRIWILRVFLRLFMKDSRSTCLRFGFGPDGNLLVSKSDVLQGELRRSCRIYSPYSSFQSILQKWETRPGRPGKEFRNGNEFARECLLWCEDQPQRYDLISWTKKHRGIFLQVGSLQPVQWVLDDPMGSRIQFAAFQTKAPACRGRDLPRRILRWIFFPLQQKVFAFRRSSTKKPCWAPDLCREIQVIGVSIIESSFRFHGLGPMGQMEFQQLGVDRGWKGCWLRWGCSRTTHVERNFSSNAYLYKSKCDKWWLLVVDRERKSISSPHFWKNPPKNIRKPCTRWCFKVFLFSIWRRCPIWLKPPTTLTSFRKPRVLYIQVALLFWTEIQWGHLTWSPRLCASEFLLFKPIWAVITSPSFHPLLVEL